jgi:two-component system phosphate regulon sensor histidine kinase PhoR
LKLPRRWVLQFALLGAWLAPALLLGWWFGSPGWWLVGALALYLASALRHIYIIDRALEGRRHFPMLETRGLWAEMYARVEKLRGKSRNRKRRYHRLLRAVRESTSALNDAGIILNAAHEMLWFNRAATRLLGLEPAADIGQRIDNFLRHPDFVRYLNDPQGDTLIIPGIVQGVGQLAVQLIPYGKAQSLVIIRDATREAMLERTRRNLLANASHELRSPLTVIGGYLDALANDPEAPDAWTAPIAEMQRQADRMTRILRDLLELTRLESAVPEAAYGFVDVASVLKPVLAELGAGKDAPVLELHLETDAALLGSEAEIHSICYNLISNAVRFTASDGKVDVTWRREDAGAELIVHDTGIGVPEELIPRITERFYRVDPGRSRETGGTGLGLAIVKHALQRHQGTLRIDSEVGRGSTFRCHFPASRVAARGGEARAVV